MLEFLRRTYSAFGRRSAVARLSSSAQEVYRAVSRNPGIVGFDPASYLDRNPDVAEAGAEPLLHFSEHGRIEGRVPSAGFSPDWYADMNEINVADPGDAVLHLVRTRSTSERRKAAFFGYAWHGDWHLDAYMRELVTTLAELGLDVDVYIGNQFTRTGEPVGFRVDLQKSDLSAFLRDQFYDFALSFNNSLVLPETVGALRCKIVSVIVDSVHHLFDHHEDGGYGAFRLPIHAAAIYTSLLEDLQAVGLKTDASFLPAATRIDGRRHVPGQERIAISWIASLVGDHNIDVFMSRIEDLPGGLDLVGRCLREIEKNGRVGTDLAAREAAEALCRWIGWDHRKLEMQLQTIVTNGTRLAVVDGLAPLGLQVFGNDRWRNALTLLPGVARSFRSGANLRRHADLCAIYDRSLISVNVPQAQAATGMQYRILDVLASKSLLITKHVPGSDMERLFGPNSPIVTFSDVDDLKAKCIYYLERKDERLARVRECNAMVALGGFSFRERVLTYLALSNASLARQVGKPVGRGSVALISAERVVEWANRRGSSAA